MKEANIISRQIKKDKEIFLFSHAIDSFYTKDQQNKDFYYSYEGCLVEDIDRILNKSTINNIEDEQFENSTMGVFSDEESKCITQCKQKRKLTDFLGKPWGNNILSLKKQISNKINKNNFLEGNKIAVRKSTFDSTQTSKIKKTHGFN